MKWWIICAVVALVAFAIGRLGRNIRIPRLQTATWAAIAATFSAVAALSNVAISFARAPEKQALYQERWRSYNEYARATNTFLDALTNADKAMSMKVETAAGLKQLSQADFLQMSKAAAEAIRARATLTEELSSVMGPWPPTITKQMLAADAHAQAAMPCFDLIGGHGNDMFAQRTDWWAYVRDQAAIDCKNLHAEGEMHAYHEAVGNVLKQMTDVRERGDPIVPHEAKTSDPLKPIATEQPRSTDRL